MPQQNCGKKSHKEHDMKKLFGWLFLTLFPFFFATFAHANLLSNGSFEDSTWDKTENPPASQYHSYNPIDPAWIYESGAGVTTGSYSYFNGNAIDGSIFAFLQGGLSSISQEFTLSSNSDLTLSFWIADRSLYGPYQSVQVLVDSVLIETCATTSTVWKQWLLSIDNLTAGVHTLSFTGTGNGSNDVTAFLDNVCLTVTTATPSVPEPSTVLLFSSGVIGLAGIARRKQADPSAKSVG